MKQKKSNSALAGKGFYIALSVCMAMVGIACYFAYTQTSSQLSEQLDSITEQQSPVDKQETGVTKATTTTARTTASPRTTTTYTTTVTTTTAPQTTAPKKTVPVVVIPEETQTNAPAFVMPLDGEILNEFSGDTLVKSKTTGAWQTHNGVDLKANLGDAVKAIGAGKVISVGENGLWGICVEIDHGNGIISRYCGLNTGIAVTVGQDVTGGTILGAVGNSAEMELAEPTHLHLEILKNGSYIDPVAYIKGE